MKKFAQGSYEVQNGSKYIGKKLPYYRSSWELAFMRMCDQHPNIKNGQVKMLRYHIKDQTQANMQTMCLTL